MTIDRSSCIKALAISVVLMSFSFHANARSTTLVEPGPTMINCSLTAAKMESAIAKGGARRGWKMVDKAPNNIKLKFVKGANKHSITVNVSHTAAKFEITYEDSINLDFNVKKDGTRRIHPKPIGWMKNLDSDIRKSANELCYE